MSEDRPVTDLVTRARNGDKRAWDNLVQRYAPLVWSICRRHQLSDADADDVQQSVWLQLVSQLDKIRDPAALPGWLAPPPGGNPAGSFARRGDRTLPGTCWTPRPSRTSTPGWRTRNC